MKGTHSILWCTSHYRLSYVKEKIRELRASGQYAKVCACSYIRDYDANGELATFAKIGLYYREEGK